MKRKIPKNWFATRYFGRGWYPSTWEGWTVSIFYVTFVLVANQTLESTTSTLVIVVLSVMFLFLCKYKGHKPNSRVDGKESNWRAGRVG